jgi:hypothetical protein
MTQGAHDGGGCFATFTDNIRMAGPMMIGTHSVVVMMMERGEEALDGRG